MAGRFLAAAVAALVFGGVALFLAGAGRQTGSAAPGAGDVANGQRLYGEYCASCHGANLEGEPDWRRPKPDGTLPAPPHDASGHTWHHDDGLLFEYTKLGGQAALAARGITDFRSGMPAFGHVLSDSDIRDILAYIKSTWPERIRAMQEGRNREDRAAPPGGG